MSDHAQTLDLQVFRSILDQSMLGIGLFESVDDRRDLRVVYSNAAFEALKPFRPMAGRCYSEIWPELADFAIPRFLDVLKTGEPWIERDAALRVEVRPGVIETRYYTYEITRIELNGSRFLLDSATETTAEVEAKKRVQQAHTRFELAASLPLVTLAETDTDLRYTWIHQPHPDFDPAAVIGKRDDELDRSDDARNLVRIKAEALASDSLVNVEWSIGRSDGRHYYDLFMQAVHDDAGRKVGLATAALNTTKRRRAQEAAKRELETTKLLLEAARTLSSTLDLTEALKRLGELALSFTGIDRAFVNLIDADKRVLTPVVATGGLAAPSGSTISFDQLSATSLEAIHDKKTALLDYELPTTPARDRQIAESNHAKLVLFVPLLERGEVIGHISLDEPGQRHQFSEREIELVEGIATQAALVIRNAELFAERGRQAEFAEALNRINQAVHSTLNFDEIMRRSVLEATQAAGLDASAIHLQEDGNWRFAYSYGLTSEMSELRLAPGEAPLSEMVMDLGTPVLIEDARADERANRQLMNHFNIGALLALPLVVHSETIGVLFTGCFGNHRRLDDHQVDFMRKVASTLSLALENARLYDNEHRIADRLQQALLTLPAQVSGIEFAHAYESATEAERVGGDFYDVFELAHDHVGIVVGDVAGKGLDAAMLTSLAKNTIRAHAFEQGKAPGRILELTNDVVFGATESEAFVTTFFGILDSRNGRLVYSNAGHTTPALVGPSGGTLQMVRYSEHLVASSSANRRSSSTIGTSSSSTQMD